MREHGGDVLFRHGTFLQLYVCCVSGHALVLLLLFSCSDPAPSDSVVANHLNFRYILESIEEAQSPPHPFVMANFRLHSIPFLLSIAYFCASSICTPIESAAGPLQEDGTANLLRRQDQEGVFSVLGIAGMGESTVKPRLEIRDLEKNHPDQWNVFLLGLKRFQEINQDDKLSYFQIAGKCSSQDQHGLHVLREEWPDALSGGSVYYIKPRPVSQQPNID